MTSISTTRRIIAVMAVTTALCADRAATSAPLATAQPVEIAQIASRLAMRLTRNLRRAAPAPIYQQCRLSQPLLQVAQPPAEDTACPARRLLSPLQLRLPPPLA